jgi:predicted DsbA family dithiol-disulfide isomerase
VSLANRMALVSPMVTARTIEANEFPDLSQRFEVQGVPRTVVNEKGAFVGALPEAQFVDAVLQLAGNGSETDEESLDQPASQ